jgi:tRNA(fMet)-specific endonuclease VapC
MELVKGAEASAAVRHNIRDVEGFEARLEVLPCDNDAAAHTRQLRAELKKIGCPIGPYDEMIAGHARSQGLVVVTNNTKPFKNVPGIRLANWVA